MVDEVGKNQQRSTVKNFFPNNRVTLKNEYSIIPDLTTTGYEITANYV